jgi:AraC-like DNA-binding protein
MAVLEQSERLALESADAQVAVIQRSLDAAAAAGAIDGDVLRRVAETARDAAGRVNDLLPGHVDPAASDEIRRRLLSILTVDLRDRQLLDVADVVLLEVEAVRHVVRDLLQEQPPVAPRDAAASIAVLEQWLPGVSVSSLAALLGMSERQLQRRRREGGSATHRLELITRLVSILRHAWTDRGVVAWFERPRHDLAGARPIELLDDPRYEPDLLTAARSGRVQGGS